MQKEEYDIFTAPKDATYFIYGHVKRLDQTSAGPIYLEHRWGETPDTIQKKNGSCPDIFFSAEVKLFKESRIYLIFNEGQPNLKDTFFHIYEFWLGWNGSIQSVSNGNVVWTLWLCLTVRYNKPYPGSLVCHCKKWAIQTYRCKNIIPLGQQILLLEAN